MGTWRRWLSGWLLLLALAGVGWAGVLFDGTDDRVSFADLTVWDFPNQSVTVVIHLKTTSAQTQYLLARRTGSGNGGWMLRMEGSGVVIGRILDVGNVPVIERSTTGTVNSGALRTVVAVFTTHTTTAASNLVDLYLNGTQDNTTTTSGGSPYNPCSTSCTLMGGALSDLSGNFFAGTIDLIEIYPGALSANEIATLGLGRLQRPGLSRARAALWPLDTCADGASANGVTFVDRSGNARNGTGSSGANGTGATCVATSALSIPWGPQ